MSDFETFTKKGGRYLTAKTASVTMNRHGYLNVPGSVRETVFDGAEYIEYHTDRENNLIALEGYTEEPPQHAYTLSGSDNGSVQVEKVLAWIGKRPPEEHTMFELQHDEETDLPYIDVSKLPEVSK
jgi:hypothetical protein